MKNQKGITLVALIITIIVMLILAGVSISLVVGENGVLTQAQNAGETTKGAEAKQQVQLAMANLLMQYYGNTAGASNIFGNDALEAAVKAEGAKDVTATGTWANGNELKVTVDGTVVTVTLAAPSGKTYPLQASDIK